MHFISLIILLLFTALLNVLLADNKDIEHSDFKT